MLNRRLFLRAGAGALVAAPAFIAWPALAQTLNLGTQWNIREVSVSGNVSFTGTWTLRPGSKTFDAQWRQDGTSNTAEDVIDFVEQNGEEVILYRQGLNGRYIGKVEAGGRQIRGTATWYTPRDYWTAEIE
jgi:hypothetical protein